jgi:hypothetical protein
MYCILEYPYNSEISSNVPNNRHAVILAGNENQAGGVLSLCRFSSQMLCFQAVP